MLQENEVASNNNAPVPAAPVEVKPLPKIEDFDVKENLIFDLTDAELLGLAKQTSLLSVQKRTKEGELKQIVENKKDEIKGLQYDINFNLKLIETGKQGREVDCIMRKDYTRGIVQYIFNGNVMKERALEHHEKVRPQDNTVSSLNQ